MTGGDRRPLHASRRRFLAGTGGTVAAIGAGVAAAAAEAPVEAQREKFWGTTQGGIATPQQRHTYFAAFDLLTGKRDEVAELLRVWTEAAARMTEGDTAAPLGGKAKNDPLDLDAADKDGNPVIPDAAHVRLATAASNGGAQILRRGYSYNDGVNFTAERWPPWRQGMEYDAGLFFVCYPRDPRSGFIRIFETIAKLDMMNQFVTHTGGGLFAIPPGAAPGRFIGQALFEAG